MWTRFANRCRPAKRVGGMGSNTSRGITTMRRMGSRSVVVSGACACCRGGRPATAYALPIPRTADATMSAAANITTARLTTFRRTQALTGELGFPRLRILLDEILKGAPGRGRIAQLVLAQPQL